jgi:hypothetical protein
MQQRRPRLGDILDDYCPRERRITNHAVVAMIEDEVKQTRCATCDAEHEYKQARIPVRRKKDGGVLAGATLAAAPRPRAAAAEPLPPAHDEVPDETLVPDAIEDEVAVEQPLALDADMDALAVAEAAVEPAGTGEEDGPVHRRLIRATLPRPEGQSSEWKDPDFTIRQPGGGRGGGFDGNRNGHRPGGGGAAGRGARKSGRPQGAAHAQSRFGAPRHGGNGRPGSGQGQGPGHGGNRGGGRPGQHGHGAGQGQHRAQRQGGRKRGR